MAGNLFVKTFGCRMNEYDSAKMVDVLGVSQGYEPTEFAEETGVLLLNTCSVREKAQEKVFSQLGVWRELKRQNPELVIGVDRSAASWCRLCASPVPDYSRIRSLAPLSIYGGTMAS